jgi:polyhydroxyalkanoate synthesis regulator protein
MPSDTFTQMISGGQQIPQVMGGYLEKGAKAVIDMQEELRSQALKLFSGFPYVTPSGGEPAPQESAAEKPKRAPRSGHKKPRAKK